MKKASSKQTSETYDVDRMMRNVALSLLRDFQSNLVDPCFCSDLQDALRSGDIARIRDSLPATSDAMDVDQYKATYQMQNLFKRYRFHTDIYSEKELVEKSILDFHATQSRLADVDLDSLDAEFQWILDCAASYIADTLGVYCDEEHRSLCRFGKRASVGVPSRLACEAARWELPISGSLEQTTWFDSEMSQVDCVQIHWMNQLDSDPQRSVFQDVDSLRLTLVPKTFKSLRSIMPNTTVGSYMSFGIGEMMRRRLKRKGYDIRKLQMKHRYLAQSASVHNLHTTADLSSASDSISVALVERLFPSDWLRILRQSRIGKVTLPDNTTIESKTFCTMGIGYTFPLQTLVFLALLHAIQARFYDRTDRRLISVYGDDMIYASRMHQEVVRVFGAIGFVINVDKTFATGQFRESCGGDYYRGVDVRPFQPRNGTASVSKRAYEAILYKYINGLLMRWSEYEVGNTLRYLTSEVEVVVSKVKLVPGDFPDDAGVKCHTLVFSGFLENVQKCLPKHLGHGVYRFSYLRLESELKEEKRHGPYLWAALRGFSAGTDIYDGTRVSPRRKSTDPVSIIDRLTGIEDYWDPLLIEKTIVPHIVFRSKLSGRRLRRKATFVAVSHTGRYTRQSGTSCFEDRR